MHNKLKNNFILIEFNRILKALRNSGVVCSAARQSLIAGHPLQIPSLATETQGHQGSQGEN